MHPTLTLTNLVLREHRAGAEVESPRPAAATRPRSAPARGGRRFERYYVGRRAPYSEVHVVTHTRVSPLTHHSYRSSAAFDWGSASAGALELAFAMLAHATDSRPPDQICLAFCAEIVACLDRAGFVLGQGDVALWLLTAFPEADGSADRPPRRRPQFGGRAIGWLIRRWRSR